MVYKPRFDNRHAERQLPFALSVFNQNVGDSFFIDVDGLVPEYNGKYIYYIKYICSTFVPLE